MNRNRLLALLSAAGLWLAAPPLCAQPAPDYYDAALGLTGGALRAALHATVAGHRALPYGAVPEALTLLDADPANPGNVILLYSRRSVPAGDFGEYNREHLWPQSLGARRHPAKSDLHHIFAVDARVNSSRGNKPYDDCREDCRTHALAPLAPYDDDTWEPPDEVKGDVARALFYMDVRYEGNPDEPDLVLTDAPITPGCDCMGLLSTLLAWHRLDPVDERERLRNDLIDRQWQGNRNPFVDHPEWVSSLWVVPAAVSPLAAAAATAETDALTIASFNVQWLGLSPDRDNAGLASVLADCDVVLLQELVAPPYDGVFPDGTPYRPDPQAAAFFDEMQALGFDYRLSEEDTGTGDRIHANGSSTEWWVAFFNPDRVQEALDLPGGFLAARRANHPDYERVPYAFPFRTVDGRLDFVLVSVHLKPDPGTADAARRRHELASVAGWVAAHSAREHDFLVAGDMNLYGAAELAAASPAPFVSLNDECRPTNTNVNDPRPYDHVLVDPRFTTEVDAVYDLAVVDLVAAMRPRWHEGSPYPGDPYDHDRFRRRYSDHDPVKFRLRPPAVDDD